MASSGYGVEATVESMWSATWDTTQFGHWNVLIGTKFNAAITGAAGTDITDANVVEELKAETHLIFAEVDAMAKISAVVNPWDFMKEYAGLHLLGDNFDLTFSNVITRCKQILDQTETLELVNLSGFGASNDL